MKIRRKSIAMIIALGTFASSSAFGQGRVAFANTANTLIFTNDYGQAGPISAGGGQFFFGLYLGTIGTPVQSLTLNLLATNSSSLPGRLSGGSPVALKAPYDDGSNYPLVFQVRGWSSQGSTILSYEQAIFLADGNTIFFGESALGTVTPTFSPIGPAALFGTNPGQVDGFTMITFVPEPSTSALLVSALTAVGLSRVFFRNRKY
jgi:hypothetical protein